MKTINQILWTFLFVLSGLVISGCEKDGKDGFVEETPKFNDEGLPLNIPDDVIVYKTIDNKPISLRDENLFGEVKLLSNEYLEDKGYCRIEFDGKVTTIGEQAFFAYENLISIVIPKGVTSIGRGAFMNSSLRSINVDARNVRYATIDGILYDKKFKTLISCPRYHFMQDYIVPLQVDSIADFCFCWCQGISSVKITENVKGIGAAAFDSCENLEKIEFYGRVYSMGDCTFWMCSKLKEVALPEGLTKIEDRIFYMCASLEKVSVPSTVNEIDISAFGITPKLKSVTFYMKNVPQLKKEYNTFVFIDKLYVPAGSVQSYKNSEWQKYFVSIEAIQE